MGGPGVLKRIKELKRQERNRDKAVEREQRRRQKTTRSRGNEGEDPDLAGIVPGPQPPAEEQG